MFQDIMKGIEMYKAKVFASFEMLAEYLNKNENVVLVNANERANLKVSTLLTGEETKVKPVEEKKSFVGEIKKKVSKKKTKKKVSK